eukprot:935271-Karenia_brevis.AAC.1
MFDGKVAAATWKPKTMTPFIQVVQGITHMANTVLHTCPCHIKSHDSHPFNELADGVCTCVSKYECRFFLPEIPVALYKSVAAVQWSFIGALSDDKKVQYHPFFVVHTSMIF